MTKLKASFLFCAAYLILSSALIFAQGTTSTAPEQALVTADSDMQWLWGEVTSIDLQKRELLVKYPDYETDSEKEMAVCVDDKTTYENIKSMEEIRPKDTVSIDYLVDQDGKNIAKNISVEKAQEAPAIQMQEETPASTDKTTTAP